MSKTQEQQHIERVKSLPCCLCGHYPPSDAHHILEGRINGRKAGDFCTIPLCKDCHQGQDGIHGTQAIIKVMHENELNLLDSTLKKLFKSYTNR